MINATHAESEEHPLSAHAALLAMAVIWGINFSVTKVGLQHIAPLAFNALRFPLAALLLYLVLRSRGGVPLPARHELPTVLTLGLLGNLLYQMCFIFGLDRTSAGNASLLLACTPIITALLSAALGHERVRARVWIGVTATFAGIVLIVLGSARASELSDSLTGDLLLLGAAVAWSFYAVGSRRLIDRYGPLPVTAWTLWIGSAGLVLAGLPELLRTDVRALSLVAWGCVLYAGVLSIGVAYIFFYYGVSRLGNTRAGAYSNIVPVFALLAAWLWLGQAPKLAQVIGAAVIIGGVSIAQSGARTAAGVSPRV
ncbi:MAG: DMT family transporter [Gemmatimonadota bacterium]